MRPIVVAGARPNFVKVAPLLRALRAEGMEPALVGTPTVEWVLSGVRPLLAARVSSTVPTP